ncbi:MAG: ATP-dependent helicase [Actinomycetota bacterium]|nr:ATP-dependent helicase [Actinomycetota bacterium]
MTAGALGIPKEITAAMGAEPTDEQWRAISMPLEPYVVVAGAGSGKTSVMAARIVYLALVALGRIDGRGQDTGVLPGNVLCLTFTNKATENLMLRVRRALAHLDLAEGEEPEILNYHGFAAQIVERHGLMVGIEPGQRVLSPAQRAELCAQVLDRMTFDHIAAEWQPSVVGKILELADQAADHCVDLDRLIQFNQGRMQQLSAYRSDRAYLAAHERIELARAAQVFHQLKRDLGVIDFGDQIALALRVVEERPDVVQEYRSRFATAILDEYQDTNVAQARLIAGLFGDGFPVTAVGDPDQNIYAWRGASLFNLLQFQRQFPRADGSPPAKLPLYTNFRSGARILAAADRIIAPLPPEQRPDPDKRLVAWEPNGAGVIEVVRHGDEWEEARWIAGRIVELHEAGERWSSCAVLCRTSRLFFALQQSFAERGIPVEVAGLTGLLKLPEVVEVLAYARAVADPNASVSLARILLGPRYRVGYKDLARVAAWAKERNYGVRGTEEGEAMPFLFTEALDHLDQTAGLSEEGRTRLEGFRRELAALRQEARRPVGEFLAEVIRRTGILAELDASPDAGVATARRRNLAAFLDEVHAFSPVEGELTLRAFLDYVDAVDASDRPEWSPVQPSDADSVKVMTIHQAKGLEFGNVFVPGLAKDLMPSNRIQQNPAERGKSLDFELRGDAEILPRFDGVLARFREALKAQELIEERRTCYVALTRARKRLVVTGAHWYGETQKPKNPSDFFEELAAWGEESGEAMVDRGPDIEEENPLIGYRQRFVQDWPGRALPREEDELFPEGWRAAAVRAAEAGSAPDAAGAELSAAERESLEAAADGNRTLARHLVEREREQPVPPWVPPSISVGGVIDYARCPKLFYWSAVRPLPRFSGPAARIGTEIHNWIQRRSTGQTTLIEMEEQPDLTAEELSGEPGKLERLREAFLASRFGDAVPLYAERPFVLSVDGGVVSGRIDAVYGTPGGPWEVVDYKTGRKPAAEDPLAGLQLDLYALACVEAFGKDPRDLTLTYLYLSSGEEDTRPAGDPGRTRERVMAALRGMAAGAFDPTPGEQCRWCDFRSFCEAGKAYLAAKEHSA